ncbi:MAG: HIT family protein [Ostreibacterium sp.]
MTDCIFCKIANHHLTSTCVYEDNTLLAIMDIFPEAKGHLLIIPKKHSDNLFEIDNDTLTHVMLISKRIATGVKIALNADGIKITQLNGIAAKQTVFHYHLHIVPAYDGVAFKRHVGEAVDPKTLATQATLIKAAL